MSRYAADFKEPIVKKSDLDEMKKAGEYETISNGRIKAAKPHQSSSLLYDPLITKFTNYIMEKGQRALATNLIKKGLEKIKRTQMERYHLANSDEERNEIELNARNILHKAIENSRPMLNLKRIKRGGTAYLVPVPITEQNSYKLAMQWLRDAIRDKDNAVHFPDKFAWEIMDAYNEKGRVINKKLELHKQCEANRAYAHYRWIRRK